MNNEELIKENNNLREKVLFLENKLIIVSFTDIYIYKCIFIV